MAARRVLLLAGVFAAPLVQSLEVRPSIQAGVVYTDNLFLNNEGAVDDVVTRLDPRIDISHQSQRINLLADYTYSYLYFSENDDSDASFSQGSAILDLTLVRNAFFLESTVEQTQQLIDPEDSVWYTNVPIVDNRTDELRLETSPHLITEIFGVAVDTRYIIGSVAYDSPDIQDVDYQEAHTAITGLQRNKGLSWGLFHDYEIYEFETPPDNKAQLAYGTLTYGFRQSGDWYAFGSLGRESSYTDLTSASLEETYWEVGFRHVTSRRLVEAAFGDRNFGSTIRGLIRQDINRGRIELSYSEDPTVDEEIDEQRPTDSTAPPPQVPPGVERPGTGNRFVYKLATASLVKELGRNHLELIVFQDKRDEIVDRCEPAPACNALVNEGTEKQTGVGLGISRQLGRRTTVGLEGETADRNFRDGNSDRISAIRLIGDYELGRQVGIEGYVAHYRQSGSDNEANNYKEFQVGLTISYDFL